MTGTTKKYNAWDRIMMAITFSEADDEKSARELLDTGKTEQHPAAKLNNEIECGNCCVPNAFADIGWGLFLSNMRKN
ncbi:MAG: hypothetical protein OEM01_00130 [Desulfobulbaceae bacterium]|nr:hypothetical protein [Desulfobulbaceae bacterium]